MYKTKNFFFAAALTLFTCFISTSQNVFADVITENYEKALPDDVAKANADVLSPLSSMKSNEDIEDKALEIGNKLPTAYKDLLPFVVPSPNQKNAMSCLYMASTGAMEVLMSQHLNLLDAPVDGPSDLTEVTALNGPMPKVSKSWYETPFLKFNRGSHLAKDVPFKSGSFWSQGIPRRLGKAPASPITVDTKKLFAASGSIKNARWLYGVLDETHVAMVKEALVENQAPVVVIYRDIGQKRGSSTWDVWHTVVIVGYDDEDKEPGEGNCPWVQRSLKAFGSSGKSVLNRAMKRGGGCRERGVFYVRDSESHKSTDTRVVRYDARSYDWLKYLGNHGFATVVKEKKIVQ